MLRLILKTHIMNKQSQTSWIYAYIHEMGFNYLPLVHRYIGPLQNITESLTWFWTISIVTANKINYTFWKHATFVLGFPQSLQIVQNHVKDVSRYTIVKELHDTIAPLDHLSPITLIILLATLSQGTYLTQQVA
jgi:hypothetical protein